MAMKKEEGKNRQLTWNPVTGCTQISPACKNCYAKQIAMNLQKQGVSGYENGFALTLHPTRLDQPLKRKKAAFYFTGSMTDLFHADVPDDFLDKIMNVMRRTLQHTYMILTKRASRLPVYFSTRPCPSNLWLGVTVEDRANGLPRMNYLRQVNASLRLVNMEPLLEDLGEIDLTGINWVTAGGETGIGARPTKKAWVINVRDQAIKAGIPFYFFKWGEWGEDEIRHGKQLTGRQLEGRTWDERPLSRKQDDRLDVQEKSSQQFILDF